MVIGGGVIPNANQGCVDVSAKETPDPESFLHLQYGLPVALNAKSDDLESDSVEGVLAREMACPVSEGLSKIESDLEPELQTIFAARTRLDQLRKQDKVRTGERAFLDFSEAMAVASFNEHVNEWAMTCEGASSDSSSDTGLESTDDASSETNDGGCGWNIDDCPNPDAAFCDPVTRECVSCDMMPDPDDACAQLDFASPVCSGGTCVECTTSNTLVCPEGYLCEDETHMCVPCTSHDQCESMVCYFPTGKCLPPDAVVHVGVGQDYATIDEAVGSFPIGGDGAVIIHQGDYFESVAVAGQRNLLLLAASGDLPTWDADMDSQLQVVTGSSAFVQGLRIAGNPSFPGLSMDGGRAWLDRVQLVDNAVGAQIEGGADLALGNCILGSLTLDSADALRVSSSSVSIIYSTLIGDDNAGNSLYCDETASVTIHDSIVLSIEAIDCLPADISQSATYGVFRGVGNRDVAPFFVSFDTWFPGNAVGDFHLAEGMATDFADLAEWKLGDPLIDLDGDPRPGIDGAYDFAGADVPSP